MAENLAQTMSTLAADSRDMKTSLRLMLKYEIQSLLNRLSDLGEESVLLLANTSDGTSGHLGSLKSNNFLTACNKHNVNLKDNFLKYCSGAAVNHSQDPSWTPSMLMDINKITGFTPATFPQACNSNLDNTAMDQPPGTIAGLLDGLNSFPSATVPSGFSMYGNTGTYGNMSTDGMLQSGEQKGRKRRACRHFVSKGYCWQGSSCSFMHTRDPELLKSLKSSE